MKSYSKTKTVVSIVGRLLKRGWPRRLISKYTNVPEAVVRAHEESLRFDREYKETDA